MAVRKRFIAGAKCPSCQAQDTLAMWRENNIDIAFNQLEVHLHNNNGETHTEVKRDLRSDDNGEANAAKA